MKLLHTICAALMMVAITSCDEHREFPDTAMKTCDILCTDGKVVRYEDMKSQNTHSMYSSGVSPAATAVFDMWQYGQSAYIPSVAEIRLLYGAKNTVNNYIKKCGGDVISDDPDECWYWTSTEVKDMESAKAWLFSLASGALQETPKEQQHKVRPIITLYN